MTGCLGMLVRLFIEVIVMRIAREIIRRLRGDSRVPGWLFLLLALLGIRLRQQIRR